MLKTYENKEAEVRKYVKKLSKSPSLIKTWFPTKNDIIIKMIKDEFLKSYNELFSDSIAIPNLRIIQPMFSLYKQTRLVRGYFASTKDERMLFNMETAYYGTFMIEDEITNNESDCVVGISLKGLNLLSMKNLRLTIKDTVVHEMRHAQQSVHKPELFEGRSYSFQITHHYV